jgi:hypothetical protein
MDAVSDDNTGSHSEERKMPHIVVKLWPGKSEQQKTFLAEAITKNVMEILTMETIPFPSRLKK